MKKIIILLLTLFCLMSFASCLNNDDNSGQNEQNDNSQTSGSAFWTPGTPLYLVFDPEIEEIPGEIDMTLFEYTGQAPIYVGETRAEGDHEIIIGDTSRKLSRLAKNRLENIALSKDLSGYVIYSDGMSVAIAYSDNESLSMAVTELTENYLVPKNDKISFDSGIVSEYSFDLYEYYDELDAAQRKEDWSSLASYVDELGYDGEETVTAFKKLYSLYSDSAYLWLANLYDPITGGFYYSNSGRDTVGFAPDLESTRQAIDFLRYSGMTDNLKEDLPKEMQTAIVEFVCGLYDPSSGLYYHPQWSRLVTTDERLGRDYTNAKTILSAFGAKQTNAVSALTMPITASAASAASHVVATAAPDHLQSEDAFLEYLNSQNWNDSYTAGNRIGAQSALIAQAGLMDVCLDFLDEKQYPETGMWAPTRDDYAVNGFLKISGIYLDAGRPIKYAKEAAETCIAVLKSELKPTTVCWVYNVWYSLANIIRNLNGSKATAEDKALAADIRSTLRANAAEYIDVAMQKYIPFLKDDGSFSYTPTRTSDMSQGMPVAVYNTNEGDVNASYISIISVPSRIFEALGYGKYEVPIYTKNDMKVFVDAISEVGEVVKTNTEQGGPLEFNGESLEGLFHSYTGVEIDTEPSEIFGKGYAYAFIDDDDGENVLHFGKTDVSVGFEPYICFIVRERSGTRYIYETKIKLNSGSVTDGGWFTKFSMYYNNGRFWQMFGYIGEDGNLLLDDPEDPIATLEVGEWYTLRFEYYTDSADNAREKVCRIYVNGEYVGNGGASGLAGEDKGISKTLIELSDGTVNVSYMLDSVNMTTDDVSYSSVIDEESAGTGSDNIGANDAEYIPSATVMDVKGGADGIVVLMHDDGSIASAGLLDAIYEKYDVKGDVALVLNNILEPGTTGPLVENVNFWKKLINTGRWNITNHSYTHTWWGKDNANGTLEKEVVTSQTILRNLFTTQRVLTYAYPGFSSSVSEYGKDEVYKLAYELVEEYYIGARDYEGRTTAFDSINWIDINSCSIGDSWISSALNDISSVAANGGMSVVFMHRVVETDAEVAADSSATSVAKIEQIVSAIADNVKSGKVWNAFFEEAILYLREAEGAAVTVTGDAKALTVSLTDAMTDNDIYNYPLTVRIEVPASWSYAKIEQGDSLSFATAYSADGKWVIDTEIVPDGGEATVTPITRHDLPTTETDNRVLEEYLEQPKFDPGDATGDYYCDPEKSGLRVNYDSAVTDLPETDAKELLSIVDGYLLFDDGDQESVSKYVKYYLGAPTGFLTGSYENPCSVVEFDFNIKQVYGSYPLQFKIAENIYTVWYTKFEGEGYKLTMGATVTNDDGTTSTVQTPLGIATNTWGTLRFEHYYKDAMLKVYVNNEYAFDIATSTGSVGSLTIYLTSNERGKTSDADLRLDNIFVGHFDKAFVSGDPNE